MGGSDISASEYEQPLHSVFVSMFWLATTPVTNKQFQRFVDDSGYESTAEKDRLSVCWRSYYSDERENHPVVCVSWYDASKYCDWLSSSSHEAFRLPTEAEWEKASRGGLAQQLFPWGSDCSKANACWGHSADELGTKPVKSYPPNGFGLYDMAGNVWEWCQDWYSDDAYSDRQDSPPHDPTGPVDGILKVRRGASWNIEESFRMRNSNRGALPPDATWKNVGFRVAKT